MLHMLAAAADKHITHIMVLAMAVSVAAVMQILQLVDLVECIWVAVEVVEADKML